MPFVQLTRLVEIRAPPFSQLVSPVAQLKPQFFNAHSISATFFFVYRLETMRLEETLHNLRLAEGLEGHEQALEDMHDARP